MGPKSPNNQTRATNAVAFLWKLTMHYVHMVSIGAMNVTRATAAFRADASANIGLGKALNLVWIFIGVFIVLAIMAALIQPFFVFLNNLADNLSFDFGSSANDQLVEAILAILVILVLLSGVIWVVAYLLGVFKTRMSR